MNDFTKEELETLRSDHWSCGANGCPGLYDKLTEMIDNYCEHDSKIDIGEAPMICRKCGKVTG